MNNDQALATTLDAIAALAKKLADDLRSGKLWPDEKAVTLATLRRLMGDV